MATAEGCEVWYDSADPRLAEGLLILASLVPACTCSRPSLSPGDHRCPVSSSYSTSPTSCRCCSAFRTPVVRIRAGELRPGYANFAIADPPLKLVLNSPGNGAGGTINHLGVEVDSADEVNHAGIRMTAEGLDTQPSPGTKCCYALQDKVWAHYPDGLAWEYYTVLEHIETP